MLTLETADYAEASITFTKSTGGTYTWTGTTERTAYDAMSIIKFGLQFAFGGTWAWGWSRDEATGGAVLTLGVRGVAWTWSATVDSLGRTALGWYVDPPTGTTIYTGWAPAAGTWAPGVGISLRAFFEIPASGDANGLGVTRPDNIASALAQTNLEAVGTPVDAARLTAVLARASNPRAGKVWQQHTSQWRQLSIGAVSRNAEGLSAYRFSIQVAGVTAQ